MIVLAFRHVVVEGTAVRRVACEKCHQPFEYVLKRREALDTVPLPSLIRSAERICRERVERRLATAADPNPCPACGWVQANMIPELRRRFFRPLATWGAFFAVASGFLSVLFLALGVWFHFYPFDLDVNWFGVAAASAGGCVLGLMLVAARSTLGALRYRARGYFGDARGFQVKLS